MASSTTRMVEVRNDKTGLTDKIKESSWKNWGSPKAENDEVRHGYRAIRFFTVDGKGKEVASDTPVAKARTFQPPSLPPVNPSASQTAAPQKPVPPASPAQPKQQPAPQGKQDDLIAIPSVGSKVAEALTKAGFGTYKALAEADPKALEALLTGMVPPMTAKVAQIPGWQKSAADFVKQAANAII